MRNKYYYVTWDEYRNKVHKACWCWGWGNSVKHVKQNFVADEQNWRRQTGKPHMFHVEVTLKKPDDLDKRVRGHLYY